MSAFKTVLFACLLMASVQVRAFNWRQCQLDDSVSSESSGGLTVRGSSSTLQFTSSTGACSAIGMREQRALFVMENFDNVLKDSSRGSGEYIAVIGKLSGCSGGAITTLSGAIKGNFQEIFFDGSSQLSSDDERIGTRIDGLILRTPGLLNLCRIES